MTICEEGEEKDVKLAIVNTHGGLTLGHSLVLTSYKVAALE